jgi:large subunit GTPase 1
MKSAGRVGLKKSESTPRNPSTKKGGLGKALQRNAQAVRTDRRVKLRQQALQGAADDDVSGLQSVLQTNSLDDFMADAVMAGRKFNSEREHVVLQGMTQGTVQVKAKKFTALQFETLQVPRRPEWDEHTSRDELDISEREAFLDWRRRLAMKEAALGGTGMVCSPFEKNLQVWRQLWRVLERSDVLVQVVDARNPLFYRSEDLEAYVREVGKKQGTHKACMLVVNKSDFLTQAQRQAWARYFTSVGLDFLFFSARASQAVLEHEHQLEAVEDGGASGSGSMARPSQSGKTQLIQNALGGAAPHASGTLARRAPAPAESESESEEEQMGGGFGGLMSSSSSDDDSDGGSDDGSGEDGGGGGGGGGGAGEAAAASAAAPAEVPIVPAPAPAEATVAAASPPAAPQAQVAAAGLPRLRPFGAGAAAAAEQQQQQQDQEDEEEDPLTRVHDADSLHNELLAFHKQGKSAAVLAAEAVEAARCVEYGLPIKKTVVGMVGFPNVGKSSVINVLIGVHSGVHGKGARVSVGANPGHTKHFQTLEISDEVTLCDCPGLVMPLFTSSTDDMICSCVLPVAQLRDYVAPIELLSARIPRHVLNKAYLVACQPGTDELETGVYEQVPARELLQAVAVRRGWMAAGGKGVPDDRRAAIQMLKDYTSGALLFCHPPPELSDFHRDAFLSETFALEGDEEEVGAFGVAGQKQQERGDNLARTVVVGVEPGQSAVTYAELSRRQKKRYTRRGKKGFREEDPYGCNAPEGLEQDMRGKKKDVHLKGHKHEKLRDVDALEIKKQKKPLSMSRNH